MIGEQSKRLPPIGETRASSLASLSLGVIRQCVDAGVRKAWSTLARHRMEWIRRHPADLVATLRQATSILIVCHGNIIRSAFAAHVLRASLGPSARVSVTSAGVDALPGRAAHPRALELAEAFHVDMTGHTASRLSQDRVEHADVIFAADLLQLTAINRQFPQARAKTYLLSCLAPATPLEVRDPINGDHRVFANCFIHILDAVHPIARTLTTPPVDDAHP
jgi:protein-tyrosine-phosphatase